MKLVYLLLLYFLYKLFFSTGHLKNGSEENREKIRFEDKPEEEGEYIDYEEVD